MIKEPKRRRDKYNPYYLETNNGEYFVKFRKLNFEYNKVKVNKRIYEEMERFELDDKKIMNEYDRHIEHKIIEENDLYKRKFKIEISIEDMAIYNIEIEKLNNIINKLTYKQRKRIYLHYFLNLKEREIATIDKCSIRTVQYSLHEALNKIRKLYYKSI